MVELPQRMQRLPDGYALHKALRRSRWITSTRSAASEATEVSFDTLLFRVTREGGSSLLIIPRADIEAYRRGERNLGLYQKEDPNIVEHTTGALHKLVNKAAWKVLCDTGRQRVESTRLITVREGARPLGPFLFFTESEWDAFLGGAKDGEFDR